MLRLRNIEKNKGMISASYEPEDSGKLGTISIDVDSGEVIESELSEYDKDFPVYFNHVVTALSRMAELENIPIDKLVMWH